MYIYVKKTPITKSQLNTLSNELYSGVHADKGLTDFYYAFTSYVRTYEEDYYRINFEVLGTEKQIAFLEMINADFDIIRVDPAEDGENEEKKAIKWWETNYKNYALPKKIYRRPIIFKLKVGKDAIGPEKTPDEILGSFFYSSDESECLYISLDYTEESYKQAKREFEEVSLEEYKQIYKNYKEAPAEPEKVDNMEWLSRRGLEEAEPIKKWWQFWK